jgi:hypothetical protein
MPDYQLRKHSIVLSCLFTSAEQYRHEQGPLMINIRREGLTDR